MEQNLKVLMIVESDVPDTIQEIFSRQNIALHHARSGAAALVLTGNSVYDLLVIGEPLPDLPIESVLSALQSFEWASAGVPALILAEREDVPDLARRLEDHPARVLRKSARKQELQLAISELLGVPVRTNSRMMINVEVKTGAASTLRCYQSQNISESGLMLKGAQALAIGTTVKVHLCLPDEADPVKGTALVVRHSDHGEDPGVGLRFVELGHAEILRLRRFVDRTLTERLPAPGEQTRSAPGTVGL